MDTEKVILYEGSSGHLRGSTWVIYDPNFDHYFMDRGRSRNIKWTKSPHRIKMFKNEAAAQKRLEEIIKQRKYGNDTA